MPHAYTDDQLVEQSAIVLFAELGWRTVSATEEIFGAAGTLLRETEGEVVLVSRLHAALERLNKTRADFQTKFEELIESYNNGSRNIEEGRAEVKKVARELLARLNEVLVINWRKKSTACSKLRLAIEDTLDTGLPRAYSPELYTQKCAALFTHVYETYPEREQSVYA